MAERAPKGVADDHGDAEPFVERAGGCVGVDREQDEHAGAGRVRGVDTGRGADEAVAGLGDHERRSRADDACGLAENHLDVTRIVAAGMLQRGVGGLDVLERNHAALRLGHGLLGHHEDVSARETAGPLRSLRKQPGEVVPLLDLGDALQREDLDSGHSRPVSRMPACAL